jgi:hypothetical protein
MKPSGLLANLHEQLTDFDAGPGFYSDASDTAGHTRLQFVEHLHGLDDHERVALIDLVALVDADLDNHARERGAQGPASVDELVGFLPAGPGAASDGLDFERVAADVNVEGLGFLGDQDFDQAVIEDKDVALALAQALELNVAPLSVQVDPDAFGRLFELGVDLAVAQP